MGVLKRGRFEREKVLFTKSSGKDTLESQHIILGIEYKDWTPFSYQIMSKVTCKLV